MNAKTHNTSTFKLEILKSFINMFNGKFITEIKETENIIYVYSELNDEKWWNFALLKKPIKVKDISLIEKFFTERKRKPSVYFHDGPEFENIKLILNKDYKISAEDCWMFWNKEIPEIDSSGIKEVKTDDEFNMWIETFINSYVKDDPQNPYGEQMDFAKLLKRFWDEGKTKKEKYFLAFDGTMPVAVGILASYNKKGYIYSIGSIPSVRGRGFGKKISLHCIKESFKQGNDSHFLATEKGHYPFAFYERIGFDPEFVAYLYTKSSE